VVDEAGVPIKGADATVNFKAGTEGNSKTKRTNSKGMATLSGSFTRFTEYGASKEGYYPTWYEKSYTDFTGMTGFRRWQPWNETLKIELRKIIKPRDLYIGNHDVSRAGDAIDLPSLDKEYGYDLIVEDWVVPYGQGKHGDFIFKLSGQEAGRNEFDFTLTLSFSNEGDGIQIYTANPMYGSRLKLSHQAPLEGYKSELVQRQARASERLIANDFPEDRNYFFRVRTKMDEDGNIVSALYGKIYGNIGFSFGKRKAVTMLYYLNPDANDRNLESDYKKNLFPNQLKYGFTEYPP